MDPRAEAVARLEGRLGHVFADRDLIERALTHASARGPRRKDNERLEFLGDRVLGLIIASTLIGADADAEVGDLTRRLHGLVNGEACARVAQAIGLGEAMRLPPGETRRGARELGSILGDACEAVIAALYIELGLERAAEIVLDLWAPLLSAPHDPDEIDPKTRLQEWAAAHGRPPPAYRQLERKGPAHAPNFTVEVVVERETPQTATAGQLRAAEKAAALALLRRLKGAA